MTTPADVLPELLREDSAAPRITCYDDSPGPTQGERIELSARVLSNWVSKAANAMQEEWDLEPGSRVLLALPPHWRTAYWALAAWSVGATVIVPDEHAPDPALVDLVVTDSPQLTQACEGETAAALVTLAALARGAVGPVPPGVLDEARELATYADQFEAWDQPDDHDAALVEAGRSTAYAELVQVCRGQLPEGVRLHTTTASTAGFLRDVLGAWAAHGSVVLSRGGAREALAERLRAEGVTLER